MTVKLKLSLKWDTLTDKELEKICDWLNKVPIKPSKLRKDDKVEF